MTRALALAACVPLLAAWLIVMAAAPAQAGGRPCLTRGLTVTATGMIYRADGPAWDRPGHVRMAQRRVLSDTLRYYTCKPKGH